MPRDVGVPRAIHRDTVANIAAAPAEEAGVDYPRPGGVHLGDKGVLTAVVGQVRPAGRRKVGGIGKPRDVSVPRVVDRDAIAIVSTTPAEESAVKQVGRIILILDCR